MILFTLMNKEDIGKYIIGRRSALRISQGRLAELSGVSVHTLSNLETGGGNVTLETLLKVVEQFFAVGDFLLVVFDLLFLR